MSLSNQSRGLAFSIVLHFFIACVLLLSKGFAPPERDQVLDLVTLEGLDEAEAPKAATVVRASKTHKNSDRQKTKPAPRISESDSRADESAAETTVTANAEPNPTDETGVSEADEGLLGREPQNESERYLAELRARVARLQNYPAQSRAFREEGTVRLQVTLDRSGSLIKIQIVEPSRYRRLNDAAMQAATRAAPFRPFPAEVAFQTWRITLPIRFTLAM